MGDQIDPGASRAVTGPQIFFWLVCLALNSVSQPNGQVCGLTYKHKAILRSSPLMCAADAVNMLVTWFFTTSLALKGLRKSATQICSHRFPTKEHGELKKTIQDLQRHLPCRWITFGLGVLPQAIKLFATRGIIAIQVFGAMYLASWGLFELLVMFADPEYDPLTSTRPFPQFSQLTLRRVWGFCGLIAHLVFVTVLPGGWFLGGLTMPLYIVLIALTGSYLIPFPWLWGFWEGDSPFQRVPTPLARAFLIWSLTPPIANAATSAFLYYASNRVSHTGFSVYFLSLFIFACSSVIISRFFKQEVAEGLAAGLLFFSILSSTLCYFTVYYKAAGSYQGAWIDWLG